ncbi:MAG: hypothetical protein WCK36_02055 [Candidatus Firestonebacteria bacterium]
MRKSVFGLLPVLLSFQILCLTPLRAETAPAVETEEYKEAAKFFRQPEYSSKNYVLPVEIKNEGLLWALRRLQLETNGINYVIDPTFEEKMEEHTVRYIGVENTTISFKEKTELHAALRQILTPLGFIFYIDADTEETPSYHINYKSTQDGQKRITVKYPFINNIFAGVKKLVAKDGSVDLLFSQMFIQVNDSPVVHKKIRELYKNLRESEQNVESGQKGKMVTKIYPLTYSIASQILPQVKGLLTKKGTIEANVKGNYLTITDLAESQLGVSNLLKELDNPSR